MEEISSPEIQLVYRTQANNKQFKTRTKQEKQLCGLHVRHPHVMKQANIEKIASNALLMEIYTPKWNNLCVQFSTKLLQYIS